MGLASAVADHLPPALLYRATAAAFRLHREQRMLFLRELVPDGCVAVDVGAWWGPWTYWLARRARRVLCFEPNPVMARHLAHVVPDNVTLEAVALSDARGTATLWVPVHRGPDALGTLEGRNRAPGSTPVEVEVRALDDYQLPEVGFVKIDVEAHEAEVLLGASETLERCRPNLLVEIEQQFQERPIEAVFDLVLRCGYEGWVRRHRRWAPLDSFNVERDQLSRLPDVKSTSYINNFVFTPAGSGPPSQ